MTGEKIIYNKGRDRLKIYKYTNTNYNLQPWPKKLGKAHGIMCSYITWSVITKYYRFRGINYKSKEIYALKIVESRKSKTTR